MEQAREQRDEARAALRKRVKAARAEGLSWGEMAQRFASVSRSHLQVLAAEADDAERCP